ncbi:DUF721 domain-containing protein [Leptospira fluminis]|uniref:DUF721 domain-containing protein n=1 Tax=Leptospira fluminis TaxID=2484979 RepID=A0A4R9GSM4_9LEPT|nr:DUF721 domain-containing protein [Leptospira fluminis]TGK21121.1 DUF721 domain-containing protein [Leptospira fluminis]
MPTTKGPEEPEKIEISDLKDLLEDLGWSEENIHSQVSLRTIAQRWSDIVGPIFSLESEPHSISGDTLIIIVSHAAYKQELFFLKQRILSHSKRLLGMGVLRAIQVRIGNLSQKERRKTFSEAPKTGLVGKDDLLKILEKETDPIAKKRLLELIEYL